MGFITQQSLTDDGRVQGSDTERQFMQIVTHMQGASDEA
jgi:hypothetical protein